MSGPHFPQFSLLGLRRPTHNMHNTEPENQCNRFNLSFYRSAVNQWSAPLRSHANIQFVRVAWLDIRQKIAKILCNKPSTETVKQFAKPKLFNLLSVIAFLKRFSYWESNDAVIPSISAVLCLLTIWKTALQLRFGITHLGTMTTDAVAQMLSIVDNRRFFPCYDPINHCCCWWFR